MGACASRLHTADCKLTAQSSNKGEAGAPNKPPLVVLLVHVAVEPGQEVQTPGLLLPYAQRAPPAGRP